MILQIIVAVCFVGFWAWLLNRKTPPVTDDGGEQEHEGSTT